MEKKSPMHELFELRSILPPDFPGKLQLEFQVENFYIVGSPVSMFLTVRGDFDAGTRFPMCKNIYNLMHPYDPVVSEGTSISNPAVVPPGALH
jgi:hypothetical protein